MEDTVIKITVTSYEDKSECPPLDNLIFAEDRNYMCTVSQICLSGKYNRTYNVITDFHMLSEDTVILDGNLLIICLFNELVVYDIVQNKLHYHVEFDRYQLFSVFKFKSGYFIWGECENRFLNKNFEVVWECSGADIFYNCDVENILEVTDEYVSVYDWLGNKYYYNEKGEININLE